MHRVRGEPEILLFVLGAEFRSRIWCSSPLQVSSLSRLCGFPWRGHDCGVGAVV